MNTESFFLHTFQCILLPSPTALITYQNDSRGARKKQNVFSLLPWFLLEKKIRASYTHNTCLSGTQWNAVQADTNDGLVPHTIQDKVCTYNFLHACSPHPLIDLAIFLFYSLFRLETVSQVSQAGLPQSKQKGEKQLCTCTFLSCAGPCRMHSFFHAIIHMLYPCKNIPIISEKHLEDCFDFLWFTYLLFFLVHTDIFFWLCLYTVYVSKDRKNVLFSCNTSCFFYTFPLNSFVNAWE